MLRTALAVVIGLGAIAPPPPRPALTRAGAQAQTPAAAHLTLLAGEVAEPYPVDPRAPLAPIATRPITFSLEVAARPSCSAASPAASYRFLLDIDGVPDIGRRIGIAPEISADAQVVAACEAARGEFTSALGTVRLVDLPDGRARIEIVTAAGRLPALRFRWIALAIDDGRYSRLPEAGRFASWAIAEMSPW